MTTLESCAKDDTRRALRTAPFGAMLVAAAIVIGAGGNTLQAVLGNVLDGLPDDLAGQAAITPEQAGLMTTASLAGTLAVPFMAIGFVAAAQLLARQAPKTGRAAGALLVLGMWGFLGGQMVLLLQVNALLSGAGALPTAQWLANRESDLLLGIVFIGPFVVGCVLGMLMLTIGLLVKGAGVRRWIPASWLIFILLDFSIGSVGPVDPHWFYLAGAVGLAYHVLRDGSRARRQGLTGSSAVPTVSQ